MRGRMLMTLRIKDPDWLKLSSENKLRQLNFALTVKYNKHSTICIKRNLQAAFSYLITVLVKILRQTLNLKNEHNQIKAMKIKLNYGKNYADDYKVYSFFFAQYFYRKNPQACTEIKQYKNVAFYNSVSKIHFLKL